ncbi:hypothetical protein SUNI508_11690 [Seiridium unicorne]|uniref:Uncharacterized protein n=1 Tax=Seiridium unicorne TaxID=138068 RepID=A0ABR2UGK4_9PEZI
MTEEEAYEQGKAELKEFKQSWYSAKTSFVHAFLEALNAYKTSCDDLTSRRKQRIEQICSEFPSAGDALTASYKIPHPENGIFVEKGIIFSYKPDSETTANAASTSLQLNEPFNTESHDYDIPTTIESRELVKPGRTSLPTLVQANREPDRPDNWSDSCVLPARPANTKLCPLKTKHSPIKTADVSKGSYWVFEHRNRNAYGYYIMRCYADQCSNPVFSKNPLCGNRAANHFLHCRQPFRSVTDMIQRYARPVITGRKDREVTQSWARKHNKKLLASNEIHLEKENFDE